jgi:RNA polymerase sigma-70 factor (ECF subfamily)
MCVPSDNTATPAPPDPATLLTEHLPRLYAFFFRRLRHHQDAEDLTNDAITLALTNWGRYDPSRPFWPWVVTIARRRLATVARCGKLKYHVPLDEQLDGAEMHGDVTIPPLDDLVRHENHDRVRDAIDGLCANHREAVLLYYFDGLKVEEIVNLLGAPAGTVYRRLSEARNLLLSTLPDLTPSGG